jgi:tripartite-type tricarboxylate transporter receptor subunit TctC
MKAARKETTMIKAKSQLVKTIGLLLAVSTLLILPTALFAADAYPGRPVRLIIPFPPGGSNDIVGRLMAAKLSDRLGKQVIADNRGGAGGVLGMEMAAKSDPDGYTLIIISSAYTVSSALFRLPFDPAKAFAPIARLGSAPYLLVVHPNVPANSVKELITVAKQRPGHLIFAANGVGSPTHLAGELLKIKADIDFKIVQFKGGGPAMIDMLGGHSQMLLGTLIQVLPHIKSGRFRVLGTGGVKRGVILPDVPTIEEAGVPGYGAINWWGILAPAGTPAPIVDRLNKELQAILALDDVKKRFLDEGVDADYMGPADFGQYIEREITQWTRVVKDANIKVD